METIYKPDTSETIEKQTGLHAVDSKMIGISKRQSQYLTRSKSFSLKISAITTQ